jgi:hypothetical protein
VAVVVWILILAVAAGVARHLSFLLIAIAGVCVAALVRRRTSWLVLVVAAKRWSASLYRRGRRTSRWMEW